MSDRFVAQDSAVYDDAGNRIRYSVDESTRSYYDAEGRLRAVDRRRCIAKPEQLSNGQVVFRCWGWEPAPGRDPGAFEEYRYDALGRRIAVRSRFDASQCSSARPEPCKSRVTRTVWDGDQLLLELRATADENLDNHTEWVAYTQGPGIDAPLMVRAKLPRRGAPYDIVPLPNWRGLYEAGVFPDGRTAVEGLDLKTISWPAAGYTAYFDYIPDGDDKEPVWLGSLMSHKRDASGQLYMRNRYYDPSSGRFTQEDPIGLAGGLNLYGFGGGDPVNYSDPFGLCAEDESGQDDTRTMNPEEKARTRCVINRYVDAEIREPLLTMLDEDRILIGTTSASAYVPWFSETMVLNGPRYFAERYEVSLAEDLVHEYRHILQQRTDIVQALYATGRYDAYRKLFEDDAESFAKSNTSTPPDGGPLGNDQGYCPMPP